MGSYPLYDSSGAFLRHVEFDEKVFGDSVNVPLMHACVVMYEGNLRQGTACTKERGDVAGSTRKPWQQKHTGRARAGSRKSPIWRGGGTIFGPRPRSYRTKMNRKMLKAALKSALLSKFTDKEVLVIEKFSFAEPATAEASRILRRIGIRGRVLVGVEAHDENLWKSVRNLGGVSMKIAPDINARDLLRQKKVLFTQGALDELRRKFGPGEGKDGGGR